jgi:hypothetical protein
MHYIHPYRGPRSLSSRATISRDLLPPRAHKGEDLTTGLEGLIPFYPAARRAFPLGNSLEPAIGCPSDNTSVLSDVATSARCPRACPRRKREYTGCPRYFYRTFLRACVRACVRACMRACVRACTWRTVRCAHDARSFRIGAWRPPRLLGASLIAIYN